LKTSIEIEGEWLAVLKQEDKHLFLAKLMHALTVVGRDSYTVQSEGLDRWRSAPPASCFCLSAQYSAWRFRR